MNKYQELKNILTNKEVVQRYLGLPEKQNSTGNWYKSPFRREKTASFCVSDKGIHDFGSSEHFDIISFVERYFNITSLQALELISRDFGIITGNEYETDKTIERVKKKRAEEKRARELLNNWYNLELINICDKIQLNENCIKACNIVPNSKVLKILYDEQVELEFKFEMLINATEEEKIQMYMEVQNDRK